MIGSGLGKQRQPSQLARSRTWMAVTLSVTTARVGRRVALLAVIACALASWPRVARAAGQADLYVSLHSSGAAQVELVTPEEPDDRAATTHALDASLALRPGSWRDSTTDRGWMLSRDAYPLRYRGLAMLGRVDPMPLMRIARANELDWLTVSITLPRIGQSIAGAPLRLYPRAPGRLYYTALSLHGAPSAAALVYGLRVSSRDVALLALAAACAVVLPVLMALRMRARTLATVPGDPATWFGYWRHISALQTVTWLLWLVVFLLLDGPALVPLVMRSAGAIAATASTLVAYALPPVAAGLLVTWLSAPILAGLRGADWTARDLVRQAMWWRVSQLAPNIMAVSGLVGAVQGDERTGIILFALGVVLTPLLALRAARESDMVPYALSKGELREAVNRLAANAGVALHELYVLPVGRGRLVNAFASAGNTVILSELLVRSVNRRELDCIVAHELTHLKHGHPRLLAQVAMVAIGAPAVVCTLMGMTSAADPRIWYLAAAAAVSAGFLVYLAVSRRIEYAADAGALKLTGDAGGVILMLRRLSSLNLMPFEWRPATRALITHPSGMKRARAAAQRAGMTEADLARLIDGPEPAVDQVYALSREQIGVDRIYSSRWRHAHSLRVYGALLLTAAVVPAAWCWMLHVLLPGAAPVATFVAGVLVATGALVWVAATLPYSGLSGLAARVRARAPDRRAANGIACALSPGAAPRIYDGSYDWDLGALIISRDALTYEGEQATFTLRRDQLTEISPGPGPPGAIRTSRVYVTWSDSSTGADGTFNLRPADARSAFGARRKTKALAARLQSWQRGERGGIDADVPVHALPDLAGVSGSDPRTVRTARYSVGMVYIAALLCAACGAVIGLPFFGGDATGLLACAIAIATEVIYSVASRRGMVQSAHSPRPRTVRRRSWLRRRA